MKKLLISLVACAGLLTSCDMNTPQYGVIDDTDAAANFDNITAIRNFLYSNFRGCTTGAYVYATELQMDQFIGLNTNGGRGSDMSNGQINTSNSTISGAYSGMYSRIANINMFIGEASVFEPSGEDAEEIKAEVARYIGEAKFFRAYCYFWLMDHYCQTYDKARGDQEGLGLSLVTVYDPTYDNSKYPGRSSMNETLKLIGEDLNDAYDALKEYEDAGNTGYCTQGATYLSSYAVMALQARVALAAGDYQTAIDKSKAVIDSNIFALTSNRSEITALWADNNVSELIFAPFVDVNESESISSTCEGWNYWWSKNTQSDYIPMEWVVYEYIVNNRVADIRYYAYFNEQAVTVQGGLATTFVFNKYPGNRSLSPSTFMYLNTPKPFRIAEQYLILAEASAMVGGQEAQANKALNDLRRTRITRDFEELDLTGDALIAMVRAERGRELIGEGFRMSDLRRWKQAFNRQEQYTLNDLVAESINIADAQVQYSADDYRYVWPIPASEMEVNPQLAGQQNPGY